MPTKIEIHELTIQKAVERAMNEALGTIGVAAAAREGSSIPQALTSGSYDSGGGYIQYEVSGDICAVYPVGP